MKQFFLQGEIDGVPVRWLVLRSTDGAVTWLDEHLVQEVVSSTWATTTFSDLEVKETTDPMPNVGVEPPASAAVHEIPYRNHPRYRLA